MNSQMSTMYLKLRMFAFLCAAESSLECSYAVGFGFNVFNVQLITYSHSVDLTPSTTEIYRDLGNRPNPVTSAAVTGRGFNTFDVQDQSLARLRWTASLLTLLQITSADLTPSTTEIYRDLGNRAEPATSAAVTGADLTPSTSEISHVCGGLRRFGHGCRSLAWIEHL